MKKYLVFLGIVALFFAWTTSGFGIPNLGITVNAKLKLELQENEAKIAKQLRQKQRQLFDMEDECADKVDAMTVKLRVAMTNHYDTSTFMRFRWHIK